MIERESDKIQVPIESTSSYTFYGYTLSIVGNRRSKKIMGGMNRDIDLYASE